MNVGSLDDAERVHAKQTAQLDADIRENANWEQQMRALLDENLGEHEFTERRMEALKLRLKLRKREQAAINYAYDPRRRRPDLIERDVKRLSMRLATKMERVDDEGAQQLRRQAETLDQPHIRDREELRARKRLTQVPDERPVIRSLDGIEPWVVDSVSTFCGRWDLSRYTNVEIYERLIKLGETPEAAKICVDLLTSDPIALAGVKIRFRDHQRARKALEAS